MTAKHPADKAQEAIDARRDQRDVVTVRWAPDGLAPRRLRFEPRDTGGWLRREQVWTGCTWRTVDTEDVGELAIDDPREGSA